MKEIATVNVELVRKIKEWDYVPVQVTILKYNDGEPCCVFASVINPKCSVSELIAIPLYLKNALDSAPSLSFVASQVRDIVKDCNIFCDGDTDQICSMFGLPQKMVIKAM